MEGEGGKGVGDIEGQHVIKGQQGRLTLQGTIRLRILRFLYYSWKG